MQLLDDPSPTVRFTAAYAVGKVDCREAAPQLIALLTDADVPTRNAAIQSIGLIKAEEAVPFLYQSLDAPDCWTRLYAAEALVRLGDPSIVSRLPALAKRDKRFAFARRRRWQHLVKTTPNVGCPEALEDQRRMDGRTGL